METESEITVQEDERVLSSYFKRIGSLLYQMDHTPVY